MESLNVVVLIFIISVVIYLLAYKLHIEIKHPAERAGIRGEKYVAGVLNSILWEDDLLFNNVEVEYGGQIAELDNVIVNKNGVFIIEVKNWKGLLTGREDDYEWTQLKISRGRNLYQKTVKNPVRQVKRQIYILAKCLKSYDFDVWVEGYAFLLHKNSPVESGQIFGNIKDIDYIIHTPRKQHLSQKDINDIAQLFS